jgi:hypothetical protein
MEFWQLIAAVLAALVTLRSALERAPPARRRRALRAFYSTQPGRLLVKALSAVALADAEPIPVKAKIRH